MPLFFVYFITRKKPLAKEREKNPPNSKTTKQPSVGYQSTKQNIF